MYDESGIIQSGYQSSYQNGPLGQSGECIGDSLLESQVESEVQE